MSFGEERAAELDALVKLIKQGRGEPLLHDSKGVVSRILQHVDDNARIKDSASHALTMAVGYGDFLLRHGERNLDEPRRQEHETGALESIERLRALLLAEARPSALYRAQNEGPRFD